MEYAPSIARYADNKNIWQNLRDGFPHPYTLSDAERFISMAMEMKPQTYFAVVSGDEAIGSIGFVLGTDVHRYTAELGYWIAQPFWNQGIASRAVKKITDYAFDDFGLTRISAEPYHTNQASIRVLEKAGYVREGIKKASVMKAGKVLDQIVYASIRL